MKSISVSREEAALHPRTGRAGSDALPSVDDVLSSNAAQLGGGAVLDEVAAVELPCGRNSGRRVVVGDHLPLGQLVHLLSDVLVKRVELPNERRNLGRQVRLVLQPHSGES